MVSNENKRKLNSRSKLAQKYPLLITSAIKTKSQNDRKLTGKCDKKKNMRMKSDLRRKILSGKNLPFSNCLRCIRLNNERRQKCGNDHPKQLPFLIVLRKPAITKSIAHSSSSFSSWIHCFIYGAVAETPNSQFWRPKWKIIPTREMGRGPSNALSIVSVL